MAQQPYFLKVPGTAGAVTNGVTYAIPVPDDYRAPANGALANHGLPFHEQAPDARGETEDRAGHRQRYSDLLDLPATRDEQ